MSWCTRGRRVVTLSIVLGLPSLALAQGAGDAARGQRLFLQCQACHALQPGVSGTLGPPLAGVVGRKAASVGGYAYSPALQSAGLVWNPATLDKWLEHPNALVPGTKMIFSGVPNSADRLAIIAYLEKAGATAAK
jgi:cytochrome c